MKLEIKHLAPYLPYSLKGLNTLTDYYDTQELTGLYSFEDVYTDDGDYNMEFFMPILRPLSDLTKEIDHNGEKFIPKSKLGLKQTGVSFCIKHGTQKYLTYHKVNKLFEWHFDVFGLIEKGLAIDINTLK